MSVFTLQCPRKRSAYTVASSFHSLRRLSMSANGARAGDADAEVDAVDVAVAVGGVGGDEDVGVGAELECGVVDDTADRGCVGCACCEAI